MLLIKPGTLLAGLTFTMLLAGNPVHAFQIVHAYRLVPTVQYEQRPVTSTRWEQETVYEKQQVTRQKPIWQTEQRERRSVTYKPIVETKHRTEKVTLYKAVPTTKYRERRVESTSYRTVTRYRDETYTVQEPVTETGVREERVTVQKPVTETLIEVQRTTSLKPVQQSRTELVEQPGSVNLVPVPDPNQRARLRALSPGYYTDPATGMTVYRNRGLHWVQPTVAVPVGGTPPSLVPVERTETSYVPETTETRRPVEFTRMVDVVETRKVPFETTRMVTRTETRRVPYEVQEPVTNVTYEKIPYTETTYQEEVVEREVPYTETRMEKVEVVEPYSVEVPKWISETSEVEVPRQVWKKVQYETMQSVPRTVMMKVPVDACGNQLGPPIPVASSRVIERSVTPSAASEVPSLGDVNEGVGSTFARRVPTEETAEPATRQDDEPRETVNGEFSVTADRETVLTRRPKSILVPQTEADPASNLGRIGNANETEPANTAQPESDDPEVPPVAMPDVEAPTATGNENAADIDGASKG